ncbi:DUF3159 domain-containing protein [Nocardioides sp. HM23]|uniref:DUF3159 domain-containing protein n=1 Tax=Nocardioides bizhenqiangii TaxID=3095076 RepID=UPI002ACA3B6A|nr:DUF3159 domain-containing protein [Nocardioides sp. HM23]MDZ5623655.1 DUF3159 domain-containing protein [Nocardioides sp. HM23]
MPRQQPEPPRSRSASHGSHWDSRSPACSADSSGYSSPSVLALWTGRARDFFLPGMVVDGIYAAVLTVSVLLGRPAVGCAYAALFGARAWRHDRRLQRVFATATLGWALVYGLRFSVQWLFYRNDEPELLALAKVGLGWPVTAAATILTVRALRTASSIR